MNKPYILLSGAIKNIGDYLIFDSAKKLIKKHISDNIIELNRWENHSSKIDLLNSSKAIIICGGPGFGENMYPQIYPIVDSLNKLKVPVTTLGVGWSGKPALNHEKFKFSENSKILLNYINKSFGKISCRDVLTNKILNQNGYENSVMTGCPVWFRELDTLETKKTTEIKKIVFTTPANRKLTGQTNRILKLLKRRYKNAEIIVSFHRGILPDKFTGLRDSSAYLLMSSFAKLKGCSIKDVSYDLEKLKFYKNADLHIGYRVHAHLFFLANGLPSILLSEDGRGLGMSKTFNLPELYAYSKSFESGFEKYLEKFEDNIFSISESNTIFIKNKYEEMKKFLNNLKRL
ncbi:MAG: polysaccharide pyruvyl transferase family protein [Bacteroidales bacterium]|nr:polysaccharide pyruvyl transferase family protein [Bacteroidales bacterium]